LQKHEIGTKLLCMQRTIGLAETRIYHIIKYS